MKNIIRYIAPLLLLLASIQCQALGLGQLVVKSSLNEPFYGTIELTGTENLTESELIVQLANEAAFARMGVIRDPVLLQLKFRPELKKGATSLIVVTSDKPIREPSLNFVLDLQSPKGQMMKEYTVLLSPRK